MDHSLTAKIETLLFIAQRPLPYKKIAQLTGHSLEDVKEVLEQLAASSEKEERGIVLMLHNDQAEFVSNPLLAGLVREYTKEEVSGELTRAGLETLTIIAYRGPLTKTQIEQIRGVNCTIVLRNLAMRGFVETVSEKDGEKQYTPSFDFLRHLGVSRVTDLPDYDTLHSDQRLDVLLTGTPPT